MSVLHIIVLVFLIASCLLSAESSSQARCEANPASYDFQVGQIKATTISDGKLLFPNGLIYKTVPVAVERAYAKSFLPSGPLIFDNNVLYLRTSSRRILIDTGSSNIFQATAGQLFQNLKAAGIRQQDIDTVLLTHAHLDHLGGLLTPNGTLAFPNAMVYIDEEEYRFWTTDPVDLSTTELPPDGKQLVISSAQRSLSAVRDKIRTFRDRERILPEVTAIKTPGHTPGHTSFLIESMGQRLFVAGDLFTQKPSVNNPEWEALVDTNSTQSVEVRYRVFDHLTKFEVLSLAYHAPWPGLGYVQLLQGAFDWIPSLGEFSTGVRKQC